MPSSNKLDNTLHHTVALNIDNKPIAAFFRYSKIAYADGNEDKKKQIQQAIFEALELQTVYQLDSALEKIQQAKLLIDALPDDDPQKHEYNNLTEQINSTIEQSYLTIELMKDYIKQAAKLSIQGQRTHYKEGVMNEIIELILPGLKKHWDFIDSQRRGDMQQDLSIEIAHNLEVVTTCCFWDDGRILAESNNLSQQSLAIIKSYDSRDETKQPVKY